MSRLATERCVSDDLESLFWVLLYLVLRYFPTAGLSAAEVQRALAHMFDYSVVMGGIRKGADGKRLFLHTGYGGSIQALDPLVHSLPSPVTSTILELAPLFHSSYAPGLIFASEEGRQKILAERDKAKARLQTHRHVMSPVLAGANHIQWAELPDVGAEDQITQPSKPVCTSRNHRE